MTSIFILGGTGNTGSKLAELLLQNPDITLTLGARNSKKLEALQLQLANKENRSRLQIAAVDVHDHDQLKKILGEQDLMVITAAVTPEIPNLAKLAIETETDMLDVIYSQEKLEKLQALEPEIEKAGRCFITEAGFHPGLPSALVRLGDSRFDELWKANIYGVIRENWGGLDVSDATIREFLEELQSMNLSFFKKGRWQRGSYLTMKGFRVKSFLDDLGTFFFSPMFFQELKDLPDQIRSLKETGFFIAGFHWFIDWFIFPLVFLGLYILPKKAHPGLARFFFRRLVAVSKPPFFTALKLEAEGRKDNRDQALTFQISHENGYWFTAIPVAAAIEQWLAQKPHKPGLHFMGHFIEPVSFFKRIETMGIQQTEHLH